MSGSTASRTPRPAHEPWPEIARNAQTGPRRVVVGRQQGVLLPKCERRGDQSRETGRRCLPSSVMTYAAVFCRHNRSERPLRGGNVESQPEEPDAVPDWSVAFWRWEWSNNNVATRKLAWLATQQVAAHASRPLLWLSAIIAAFSVIADSGSRAADRVRWRNQEYSLLQSLHVGYQSSYFDKGLGTPSIRRETGKGAYSESVYVRRDYFVQTVVDKTGVVRLYSVISCDDDFQPTFRVLGGVDVTLQREPLARSASDGLPSDVPPAQHPTEPFLNDDRSLYYLNGSTSSTPEHYIESWGGRIACHATEGLLCWGEPAMHDIRTKPRRWRGSRISRLT